MTDAFELQEMSNQIESAMRDSVGYPITSEQARMLADRLLRNGWRS